LLYEVYHGLCIIVMFVSIIYQATIKFWVIRTQRRGLPRAAFVCPYLNSTYTYYMECAFCQNPEVESRIVIKNELAFSFPTYTPIVPGHLLITPIRHVQYYEDLTQDEKNAMEEIRVTLKHALQKVFAAEGFNYAWNENEVGGQSVPHVHLHVLPRKEGDAGIHQYDPGKFLYRPSSNRPILPSEELTQVSIEIRNAI
jgi:histidine triad (HIT) family protein